MEEQATTPQSKGMNPMIPLGLVVLVVVIGLGVWLSGQNKNNNNQQQTTPSQQIEGQSTGAPTQAAADDTDSMNHDDSMDMADAQEITVEGGSFYFKPNEIRVKKGQKVKVTLTNAGGFHDFVIDELNVKSEQISAGATTTVEFTADKAGTFEFYCSVGNHRQMGMKGNLIVEE